MTQPPQNTPDRRARLGLWLPGLLVALGAAVATAHGLFEVARAASTPAVIAGLYPLITDGLALVAYAATARLSGSGRRYAWAVVVLAAGLSGLAQASYLAHGAVSASTVLRFGIGAWPAIAAAIVAHLLYLIMAADKTTADDADAVTGEGQSPTVDGEAAASAAEPETQGPDGLSVDAKVLARGDGDAATVRTSPVRSDASKLSDPEPVQGACGVSNADHREPVQHPVDTPVQPPVSNPVQPEPAGVDASASNARTASNPARPEPSREAPASPRVRAERAAREHAERHGALPSARELAEAADVSRGTAASALKTLRTTPTQLHVVHEQTPSEAQQ